MNDNLLYRCITVISIIKLTIIIEETKLEKSHSDLAHWEDRSCGKVLRLDLGKARVCLANILIYKAKIRGIAGFYYNLDKRLFILKLLLPEII